MPRVTQPVEQTCLTQESEADSQAGVKAAQPLPPHSLGNGITPKCFSFPSCLQRRNDQRIPTDMLSIKAAFQSALQGDFVNLTKPPGHVKPLPP